MLEKYDSEKALKLINSSSRWLFQDNVLPVVKCNSVSQSLNKFEEDQLLAPWNKIISMRFE